MFSSKGDMTRIREWVRSTHNDPLPVGLFIPFAPAYQAVKEFIAVNCPRASNGQGLPPNTFPEPWNVPAGAERSYLDVTGSVMRKYRVAVVPMLILAHG
jgi:hypothetical protein